MFGPKYQSQKAWTLIYKILYIEQIYLYQNLFYEIIFNFVTENAV